jgi:hypothetical protein
MIPNPKVFQTILPTLSSSEGVVSCGVFDIYGKIISHNFPFEEESTSQFIFYCHALITGYHKVNRKTKLICLKCQNSNLLIIIGSKIGLVIVSSVSSNAQELADHAYKILQQKEEASNYRVPTTAIPIDLGYTSNLIIDPAPIIENLTAKKNSTVIALPLPHNKLPTIAPQISSPPVSTPPLASNQQTTTSLSAEEIKKWKERNFKKGLRGL